MKIRRLAIAVVFRLLSGPAATSFGDVPGSNTPCSVDSDCPLINCLIAPCPAAVCTDGTCGVEANPPNPECLQDSDCPEITCFAAPCDANVCDGGLCVPRPPDGDNLAKPEENPTEETPNTGGSTPCSVDSDCPLINCLIAPCPAAVCNSGTCGVEANPPNPECTQDSDCPAITCFAAPCDNNVCDGGICVPQPPDGDNLAIPGETPCSIDSDCPLINCLIPPCPAAVCNDGTCGVEANPPNPECTQDSDCPPISCFAAPCDDNVCDGGLCVPQPPSKPDGGDNPVAPQGIPCGPNTCYNEPCCNESCGHCGSICTDEYCLSGEDDMGESFHINNNNNTLPCNSTFDCPLLPCSASPCYQYECNATLRECLLTEADMPCDTNSTEPCYDSSVNVEKSSSDAELKGDREVPSSVLESKSTRQTILLESAVVILAASLLSFL